MGAARGDPGPALPGRGRASVRAGCSTPNSPAGWPACPGSGLAPLVEQMLGLHLRKGHGAADWSTRPLPHDWLVYAALDVEVLVELRDAMEAELARQGKLDWAHQEFAALVAAPPPPPRSTRGAAPPACTGSATGGRWPSSASCGLGRDALARRRDVAPHRVLPDSAIIAAAAARPTNDRRPDRAAGVLRPHAAPQRRPLAGRDQPGPGPAGGRSAAGPVRPATVRPRPPSGPPGTRWRPPGCRRPGRAWPRCPSGCDTPVENLLSPDLVRRVLWTPAATDAGVGRGPDRGTGRARRPPLADRTRPHRCCAPPSSRPPGTGQVTRRWPRSRCPTVKLPAGNVRG